MKRLMFRPKSPALKFCLRAGFSISGKQRPHKLWIDTPKSLVAALLGLLTLAGQVNAYEVYSAKKGVGNGTAAKIHALNVSWYYNWNIQRVAGVDPAIEYVPMKHNQWWQNESELANIGEFHYFLGFNEPERSDQGNITVAAALNQWPTLTAAVAQWGAPGSQMGSPVTANPGHAWITNFMAQATNLGYQVDFMAMHKYPEPTGSGQILSGAQWYYTNYNRDVWITEFNFADWTAPNDYNQSQSYTWMAETLFRLESTSYIKRYAVFPWTGSGSADSASPIFDTNGVITPLGKLYAEYRSSDISGPYVQTWYHLHNKGVHYRLCDNAGAPATADIFTEGGAVEFQLVNAGGGNVFIANQATGKWLASDGSSLYWTDTETGSAAQWALTTAIYGWKNISHVGSGKFLYAPAAGTLGLNATVSGNAYSWAFARSGTVYVGNTAPVFTSDPMSRPDAIESVAYSATLAGSATDADNDVLTYTRFMGPTWLNVASDGTLSGTPPSSNIGSNSWTIQVSDANGGSDIATLNITVNGLVGNTMASGYSVGSGLLTPSGQALFVDHAALGGNDTTATSGYSDAFTVLIDGTGRWNIGDTVEITGIALPIHGATLNGTITFTVRQGSGGAGDTGAGGLAVLGTATANYTNSGTTGNMYVNFGTPVTFVANANSTSIGINIANTTFLRLKNYLPGTVPVKQYNLSTGNTVGSMNVSVAGKVTPASSPTQAYVSNIGMSSASYGGSRYSGVAAVKVLNNFGSPVAGASVSVNWSGATSETQTGSTDGSGVVVFVSSKKKNGGTFTVTVSSVTASGLTYTPGLNIETSDSIRAP